MPDRGSAVTVEQDLRETLQERATRVSPSPDGWTSITLKIDHRRQRARVVVFAFAALLPVAAVGATLAAVRDGNGARPVDTAGPSLMPSTPKRQWPAPYRSRPTVTNGMRGTTTVPRNPVLRPPPRPPPGPPGSGRRPRSELDEIQKELRRWSPALARDRPDGVAKVFLLGRALSDPKVEPTDRGAAAGPVPYASGGVGGTVSLGRDATGASTTSPPTPPSASPRSTSPGRTTGWSSRSRARPRAPSRPGPRSRAGPGATTTPSRSSPDGSEQDAGGGGPVGRPHPSGAPRGRRRQGGDRRPVRGGQGRPPPRRRLTPSARAPSCRSTAWDR